MSLANYLTITGGAWIRRQAKHGRDKESGGTDLGKGNLLINLFGKVLRMNPPYILVDGGDITLFRSVTALEQYVESPDIDRYSVFDSMGRRLHFEDIPARGRAPTKFGIVPILPVRLASDETTDNFEEERLLMHLRSFLARVVGSAPDSMKLPELLKKVQDLTGVLG
jgi:hypothetical protein